MGLQLSEISEIVKKPKNSNAINGAISHEQRVRMHTDTAVVGNDMNPAVKLFLDWVKTLIPEDKFRIFKSLLKFPLKTNRITDEVFRELERVFDGRNATSSYQFNDSTLSDDWDWYRCVMLHEPDVWRQSGWDNLKTAINSIVVIDLSSEQTGEKPEPYFYMLNIGNVIDFDYVKGKFNYIIFKQEEDRIAVFDDEFMRVLQLNAKREIITVYTEVKHHLGYCPATFFWDTPISRNQPFIKKSPISKELSNLDWYLFFDTSKKHLDLYAPYPIYSAYEQSCDYDDEDYHCVNGYLKDSAGKYKISNLGVEKCPICSQNKIAGVGSLIEIPIPSENGDVPDMRNPIQITTIDRASLDYNVDECNRLRTEIITSIVGVGGGVNEKEAINEMQVTANFESKSSVLNSLKINFEKVQKFVNDTVCRLRYGDSFLSSSINWGTEFYTYTVSDLQQKYTQAKINGASEGELDVINTQIIEIENKNNTTQLQRLLILKHLEPYRHYNRAELNTLYDKGVIDENLFNIKINFNAFIDRFERENISIIEFGSELPFDKKIEIINQKLLEYGKESRHREPSNNIPNTGERETPISRIANTGGQEI